jgi:hypothetical protein
MERRRSSSIVRDRTVFPERVMEASSPSHSERTEHISLQEPNFLSILHLWALKWWPSSLSRRVRNPAERQLKSFCSCFLCAGNSSRSAEWIPMKYDIWEELWKMSTHPNSGWNPTTITASYVSAGTSDWVENPHGGNFRQSAAMTPSTGKTGTWNPGDTRQLTTDNSATGAIHKGSNSVKRAWIVTVS